MDIKIENEDDSYAEYQSTSCSMDNQHVEPESDSNTSRMHQQLLGLGCNISINNMLEIKKECENTMSENESNEEAVEDPAHSLIDIEGKIIRIKTEPVDDTDENTWGQFVTVNNEEPQKITSLKRKNKRCSKTGQDGATATKKKKILSEINTYRKKSRGNKKDNNKDKKEEMDYRNRSSPLLNIGNQLPRWKNIASEFKFNDVKVAEGLIDCYYYVKRGDAAKAMFGEQYKRWLKVRKNLNFNTHEELTEFLLNSYYSKMCKTQQTPEESITTTSNQKTTKESDSTPSTSTSRQSEDDVEKADYTFNCASCGGEWLNRKKYKKHVAICNRSRMVKHVVEPDCAINANVVTYDVRDDGRLVEKNQRKMIQPLGLTRKKKKSHQAKDAIQKSYKAKICNEHLPSTSKSYVDSDSVGHDADTGRRPSLFNCEKCRKTFATENSLIGHTCQSIKTKLSFKPCRFCTSAGFTNSIELHDHIIKYHPKRILTCTICKPVSVFYQPVLYKYHLEMHANKDAGISFECVVCKKLFKTEFQVKCHQNDVHKMDNLPFDCKKCGHSFRMLSDLDHHLVTHSQSAKRKRRGYKFRKDPKTCDICGKTCLSAGCLKTHMTRMHIDTTPKDYKHKLRCYRCDDIFENKSLLDIHMKTHRDAVPEKNELICSLCEEVFLNRVIFKKHMNSVHKEVECNVCQKVLSNAEKLKRHMKLVHDETKPFQCDWPACRRNFENKFKLDNHIMIRHKNKLAVPVKERTDGRNRKGKVAAKKGTKIRCSMCRNKYCLTEETFQRHMRSFHGKPLKTCEDHMKVEHNGIKIFKCDICKMTMCGL